MKPEELLNSLEYVGEDLLASAEQTVLARKHRPWVGTAAAAVLLVVLGVGGFFLWKSLERGSTPAATGNDPSTVAVPNAEPDDPADLPLLTVGDSWAGRSRVRFDDPERSAAGTLVKAYGNLASLPVYKRLGSLIGDARFLYNDKQLSDRLDKAADQIGVVLSQNRKTSLTDDGKNAYTESFTVETDQGTLTVYADGRILMLFDEAHAITSSVKVELSGELSPAETERALRDARMEDCGEQLAERLGLGECRFVTCDRWDPASSAWTVFTVYPVREDPAEQLISRYFESVRLLTNDGWTLRGFELDRFPREDLTKSPEGLRLVGSYPVIAAGEAANALDEDAFLCEEDDLDRASVYRNALWEQLVYLPEGDSDVLMPFFRYWVPADETGESGEYIAVYVPAVRDAYLSDWELHRYARLPTLTLGEVAKDEAALLLTDPEAYHASNPWREEERINTLPVYRLPETGAQDAAMFLFAEEDRYTPDCGVGLQGSQSSNGLIFAFLTKVTEDLGLNPGLSWSIVEGEYPQAQTLPGVDTPLYAAEVYPMSDSSWNCILNYNLERITLWYRDGTLWGYSLPCDARTAPSLYAWRYGDDAKTEEPASPTADPDAATQTPVIPAALTQIGLYPLISPSEARALAQAGRFAGASSAYLDAESREKPSESKPRMNVESLLMDLIYLPNESGEYLLPFYRFLSPVSTEPESGASVCRSLYVPAVTDLYLADYPSPDGTEPDETEPDETEPEPPTPTGGYLPAPVETAEGQFEIQGLEGKTVKAMNYCGDCQDPVWADLDGDGETELVYWCAGPTSGLFTVGICVYDLKDGWPVLEAHMIYCLDWGEISLSEENGSVFFHYTPHRWDPARQTSVPEAEALWPVTLGKGGVVLNGGDLPEDAALWGGEEWGWYGSSFEGLKAQKKEQLLFSHWSCLVWTDSKETESGARQYVFAAVSENGVTVTGLLRYQRQPDGSWFCARQGLELIEAPEDPDALAGLTMEALEARFGPWHFDMGSGLYIPCWFTEDCQLLIVHPGYSAELKPLTALGD